MKKDDVKIGGTYFAKVSDKVVPVRIAGENRHGGWDATNTETGKTVRIKSAQRLRGAVRGGTKAAKAIATRETTDAGGDDRCSTPGCDGRPTMTHLERRLCDACWARHCEQQDGGEKREAGDAAVGVEDGASDVPAPTLADLLDAGLADDEANATPVGQPDVAVPLSEALATSDVAQANAASWNAVTPKRRRAKTTKDAGEPKPKRTSALDAAAQVLKDAAAPMNCKVMIETMAAKGLWTSPGGKTPAATLYSAILREIGEKGDQARFKKTDRGQFAFNG